jgi:hypothetical protein
MQFIPPKRVKHLCSVSVSAPMSRIALAPLLCVALATLVWSPLIAGAQSTGRTVSLAAVVQPYATIEGATSPAERRAGDSTEYRVTLTVRANTSYRVVARRAGPGGLAITLGAAGTTARLSGDRTAVQVARGEVGVTTFTFTYAAADVGALRLNASAVWFDAVPDSSRP